MYSSIRQVNTLTALLIAHGVRHAVVCPGSRNSPLVHNLNEAPAIQCYPVTDERSSGFFALGISLQLREPVVVCVTSGTALLNVLPAVAEAKYQHVPLIVVSADRPRAWIDQLDGQTLPQADALGRFVRRAVSLPEGDTDEDRWYTNRLINEALLDCRAQGGGPVHINVPLHEPLYIYNVAALPEERVIRRTEPTLDMAAAQALAKDICRSPRRMVVIGQLPPDALDERDLNVIQRYSVIIGETLSGDHWTDPELLADILCHQPSTINDQPSTINDQPTTIIYVGGCLVSKKLKAWLRQCDAEVIRVSEDGEVADTFGHLMQVVTGSPRAFLHVLAETMERSLTPVPSASGRGESPTFESPEHPAPLEAFAMQLLDKELCPTANSTSANKHSTPLPSGGGARGRAVGRAVGGACQAIVHVANSTAIRLANRYLHHYVYCNRGVNGIEGSLSTAAGQSVAVALHAEATGLTQAQKVVCVIGDLSFFYDQNALWNQNLRGNLRVLLLNNHGGGIFSRFEGLRESAARERLVMAEHPATAEGICLENRCTYLHAATVAELQQGIHQLLTMDSERPVVLEVSTLTP